MQYDLYSNAKVSEAGAAAWRKEGAGHDNKSQEREDRPEGHGPE